LPGIRNGHAYVANAGDGSLHVSTRPSLPTFTLLAHRLGTDADNIRVDRANHTSSAGGKGAWR
jgi:hypothetical protein